MPGIFQTYYAKVKDFLENRPFAIMVGVTYAQPPFNVDLWAPFLAPKGGLLHDIKDERIDFEEYEERFRLQVSNDRRALVLIDALAHMALGRDVCVLCFEKDASRCHRTIVKEMIEHRRNELLEEFKMNYALIQGRVNRDTVGQG